MPTTPTPAELEKALVDLTERLEAVFDNDWSHTRSMIADERGRFIAHNGTFLNPNVADESDDWDNRAGLLRAYRHVRELLGAKAV